VPDANNILGVILSITVDVFYKIGTKNGILSSLYAKNQIFECKKQLIRSKDSQIMIPLRTASIQSSLTGGRDKDLFFVLAKLSVLQRDVNVNKILFFVIRNVMAQPCVAINKYNYFNVNK